MFSHKLVRGRAVPPSLAYGDDVVVLLLRMDVALVGCWLA